MKPAITITSENTVLGLNVRLDHVVEALSKDDRIELIRMVAMDEPLRQDIVDQLICGWTQDGCSVGNRFLNELRVKLLPLMGEVAKEAICEPIQERDLAKADAKRHSDWAWSLFHAWPREDNRQGIPPLPTFAYTHKISNEEARKFAGVEEPENE